MEQNMFIRILNSEMELATGCTEPGAVALTAAEAGQALRKAGVDKAEEITVNASINIIKNAMSAGTWVIRQAKSGGAWEWVQPLAVDLQFTPRGSARRAVKG